jgi:hypothetical protein
MANAAHTGSVVSGSGNAYMVALDPQATPPGATVSVTQIQIDSSQTIPAGTAVIVVQIGSSYYMQAPVWGAAP